MGEGHMADDNAQQEKAKHRDAWLFEPEGEEDRADVRRTLRNEVISRQLIAYEKFSDQLGNSFHQSREYSKEYGQTFIKTVFLLNGGAIIALLTFIGSMYTKDALNIMVAISLGRSLVPAFLCFAGGLVCAALVAAIAYFNWNYVASSHPGPMALYEFLHGKPLRQQIASKAILWTYRVAIVVALLSLGFFGLGAYLVTTAFTVLGIG
jgi:hypothetical protein